MICLGSLDKQPQTWPLGQGLDPRAELGHTARRTSCGWIRGQFHGRIGDAWMRDVPGQKL